MSANPMPNQGRSNAASSAPIPSGADSGHTRFADDHQSSEAAQNAVVESMDRHGYSKASRFAVRLALAEAIANAFKHGHKGLPPSTSIGFSFEVADDRVLVVVEDQGPGFKPEDIPDPTLDENIEKASGRGLMLIKAYITHVAHNAKGNRLEMIYEKPKA
jgi:serine/threonine-protein kinase RsbW